MDDASAHPDALARLIKVLAVGTRIRIIEMLKGQPLCVNALATRLDVTQGAVSQHLRVLRDAGLVIDEKRGYFVHYRVNEEALGKCRAAIDELLTPPCQRAGCTDGEQPCAAATRKTSARSRRS